MYADFVSIDGKHFLDISSSANVELIETWDTHWLESWNVAISVKQILTHLFVIQTGIHVGMCMLIDLLAGWFVLRLKLPFWYQQSSLLITSYDIGTC